MNDIQFQAERLAEMTKLMNVLSNGLESSSKEEIISSFEYIRGSIEDIAEQLNQHFGVGS